MFIGHFAVGFAAKRLAPRTSLATLVVSALLPDLLFPMLVLAGVEHTRLEPGVTQANPFDLYDYPWSHSLLMACVWASGLAVIYHAIARYWPGTMAVWIGVVSHWLLDCITHRPDMPLVPGGGPKYGLGLWNSIVGTMTVELAMLVVGVAMYARATEARDGIGKFAFAAYLVLLVALYVGDRFSPPPSSPSEIAWTGVIAEVVLLLWAWWFDRHRAARAL